MVVVDVFPVERGAVDVVLPGIDIDPGVDVPVCPVGIDPVLAPIDPAVDPVVPGDITDPALVPVAEGLESVIALVPVPIDDPAMPAAEPVVPAPVPVRDPGCVPVVIDDIPLPDPLVEEPVTPACPGVEPVAPVAPTVLEGAPTELPAPALWASTGVKAKAAATATATGAIGRKRFMILAPEGYRINDERAAKLHSGAKART